MKLSVRFVLFLVLLSRPIYALQLEVTSDLLDMMISKNIGLRLKCTGNEEGVLRRGLCFSVDNPEIILTSWKASLRPIMMFNERFKKSKRTFLHSANFYVLYQIDANSIEQIKKYLMEANIYVSGFVVHKNGSIKSFNMMTHLVPPLRLVIAQQPAEHNVTIQEQEIKPSPFLATIDLNKEHEWDDRFEVIWKRFLNFLSRTFTFGMLLAIYVLVIVMLAALMLRRFNPWLYFVLPVWGMWQKELRRFLIFLWMGGTMYFTSLVIQSPWVFYSGAMLCFVGMMYAYWTERDEYFVGRLKGLVGFVLGVLVLPLLAQAYFLWGL